jgi:hypothetical protein
MAIRAPIVLTDGATTPVNHTFNPTKSDGDTILFVDQTQSVYVGQNRLSVVQKLANKNSPYNSANWRFLQPILAVTAPTTSTGIQPAPSVAYENSAALNFKFHARSTLQERKDILTMMRDLIDEAIVTNQCQNLDFIY